MGSFGNEGEKRGKNPFVSTSNIEGKHTKYRNISNREKIPIMLNTLLINGSEGNPTISANNLRKILNHKWQIIYLWYFYSAFFNVIFNIQSGKLTKSKTFTRRRSIMFLITYIFMLVDHGKNLVYGLIFIFSCSIFLLALNFFVIHLSLDIFLSFCNTIVKAFLLISFFRAGLKH